jgi:hypothetical protein
MNSSVSENDGLKVTINEDENSIDFEWNPETHPQWNVIEGWGKEGLLKVLTKAANETLETVKRTSNVSVNTRAVIDAGHQVGWVNRNAIAAVIKVLADKVASKQEWDENIAIDDIPPYIEGCQDRQEEIRVELLKIASELEGFND